MSIRDPQGFTKTSIIHKPPYPLPSSKQQTNEKMIKTESP